MPEEENIGLNGSISSSATDSHGQFLTNPSNTRSGTYYNNPSFDVVRNVTKRRITKVVPFTKSKPASSKYYELTIPRALPSTVLNGAVLWIQYSGRNWEPSWLDGYWRLRKKSGTVIQIDKQGMDDFPIRLGYNLPITANLLVVDAYGSEQSFEESVPLRLLPYQNNLKGVSSPYTMSPTQRKVYEFLKSFYSLPEIQLEYRAKYALSNGQWNTCGYGPTGDFALAKVVDAFMCVASSASGSEVPGVTCWDRNKIVEDEDGVKYYGLWQIPVAVNENYPSEEDPDMPWATSPAPDGYLWEPGFLKYELDDETLCDPEINTRAAVQFMAARLFMESDDILYNPNVYEPRNDFDRNKPFRNWTQSTALDAKYSACVSSKSKGRLSGYCGEK